MALLGELAVNLIARTSQFTKEMGKAKKSLTGLEKGAKQTQKAWSLFTKTLAGVGIGLSVRELAVQFQRTAQALDELAKASTRLGISAKELEGWRHAASLAGIQTNTLDLSIQRLARRVAEAAVGTGEAKGALDALGLSAQSLVKQNPSAQLMRIVEAMQSIGNENDQLRIAFKLFDTEGVKMVQLIRQGVQGVRDAVAEGQKGVATEEELQRAERFQDVWTKISKDLRQFKEGVVLDVSPTLSEAIEGLMLIQKQSGAITKAVGQATGLTMTREVLSRAPGVFDNVAEFFLSAGGRVPSGLPKGGLIRGTQAGVESLIIQNQLRQGMAKSAPGISQIPFMFRGMQATNLLPGRQTPAPSAPLPEDRFFPARTQPPPRATLPPNLRFMRDTAESMKAQQVEREWRAKTDEAERQRDSLIESMDRIGQELKARGVTEYAIP